MPKLYHRVNGTAEKLDCHPKHVWRLVREDPNFPRPIRMGKRHVLFDDAEIDAYVASKRQAGAA